MEKPCLNCERRFSTNRSNRVFCSDRCRFKFWRANRDKEVRVFCPNCKTAIKLKLEAEKSLAGLEDGAKMAAE